MNILKFLNDRNMTQQELGDALGTSNQNVNRWVTGKGVPSYEFCKKLLEMGMSVEDLFDISEYHPFTPQVTPDEFKKRFDAAMAEWMREHPPKLRPMTDRERQRMAEIDPDHDADFDP